MNPLIGDLRITITVDIPRMGWLPYDIRKNMVERDIRDAITDIAHKCTGSAENYTHVEMREIDLKRIDKMSNTEYRIADEGTPEAGREGV